MKEEIQGAEKGMSVPDTSWKTTAVILICAELFDYGLRKGRRLC